MRDVSNPHPLTPTYSVDVPPPVGRWSCPAVSPPSSTRSAFARVGGAHGRRGGFPDCDFGSVFLVVI